MLKRQTGFIALLAAAALLVGCQTPEPTPESSPPSDTRPISTPPPTAEELPTFNDNMEPYFPGTTNLLPRVFYFELDQAVIGQQDLEALQTHAQVLIDNPRRRVMIEGHCDERGTREYNLALGERRSDAVASFLKAAGVPASRIETVSYGEERPADPGHTEAAWSRNRRAVMIYR